MAKSKSKDDKSANLTDKQKLFAQEYLIDLNATGAYRRAGYAGTGNSAEVCASQLLSNPKVSSYIQECMNKRSEKVQIDAEYVLSTIKETVERCKQVRPVLRANGEQVYVDTPDGDVVPAFTFDSGAVLKGAELLGKHLKMFTDKVEHTGAGGGAIETSLTVTFVDSNS